MLEEQEQRHIYYDRDLAIEAYNLSGVVQKFPNHFHEYYVIGFMEGGKRHLHCLDKEYDVSKGDMLLFNPRDNHFCAPMDGTILDYRAVNINVDVMMKAMKDITGKEFIPHFHQNVVYQSELAQSISELYDAILYQKPKLEKEEALFFLLDQLIQEYASPFETYETQQPSQQIKQLCDYMEEHFAENVSLDELLSMTNYGKSYLLRSFTKQVGVSPYRYLQTIRLNRAKEYLEQGITCVEVASLSGFTDQSHFANYFKEFIGLTPKQYQRIFQETAKDTSHE